MATFNFNGHVSAPLLVGGAALLTLMSTSAFVYFRRSKAGFGQAKSASAGRVDDAVAPRPSAVQAQQHRDIKQTNFSPLHHLDLSRVRSDSNERARHASSSLTGTNASSAVFRVVLTGGPCGGKSSSMVRLETKLRALGYDVILAPEIPTLVQNAGARYVGMNDPERRAELLAFELAVVELQIQLENSLDRIAQSTRRPTVIIFDRGILDVAAYMPVDMWGAVLNHDEFVTEAFVSVVDRYDLVLILTTAADGAEDYFRSRRELGLTGDAAANKASSVATDEELERARLLDRNIANCWSGHPHASVVGNTDGGFEAKLRKVEEHVLELVTHHRLLI